MPNPLERLKPMEAGKEAMETGRAKVGELLGKAKELGQLKDGNKLIVGNVQEVMGKIEAISPSSKILEQVKKKAGGANPADMMGKLKGPDFGFRQMGSKTEKGI
ncbi:hypothetical protein KKC88_00985 [Patescibacteria group bacterium]|nr:hypothetical protein [Patescibacteria group bacterium]MBU1673334.1 hypothetical protein [Patescibacteria group bacterium]MBU1963547.1 hypothetical protein [Patescibacteria group bacterium]